MGRLALHCDESRAKAFRSSFSVDEFASAGCRRIERDLRACNLVVWEGEAKTTIVASVWRSRAWN